MIIESTLLFFMCSFLWAFPVALIILRGYSPFLMVVSIVSSVFFSIIAKGYNDELERFTRYVCPQGCICRRLNYQLKFEYEPPRYSYLRM